MSPTRDERMRLSEKLIESIPVDEVSVQVVKVQLFEERWSALYQQRHKLGVPTSHPLTGV